MNRLQRLFGRLGFKKKKNEISNAEELRHEFKIRNHCFKLLLNANNCALENMAQMERALMESKPFSISFVKAKSTAIVVDVFRMIRNLNELCPGKYDNLNGRFKLIEQDIARMLTSNRSMADKRLVIPLDSFEPGLTNLIGCKMANLADIKSQANVRVPGGFSITAFAYNRFKESNFLKREIDRQFQSADFNNLESLGKICDKIQQLILDATLPTDLVEAIESGYRQLEEAEGAEVKVALRSSALGE
ncbi:PEP/pyruvate-binding domain-containing protein, partial [bacterium]|nr:PEP/pyruvate-binding domain-containing protein [bacterium]